LGAKICQSNKSLAPIVAGELSYRSRMAPSLDEVLADPQRHHAALRKLVARPMAMPSSAWRRWSSIGCATPS
jgi:hypothetical protein